MGYFSNGSEGMGYQDHWCERCIHWQDLNDDRGYGCPVWDAHLIFNGDKPQTKVLDMLIPQDKKGNNKQCLMFVCNGDAQGQTKMFDD